MMSLFHEDSNEPLDQATERARTSAGEIRSLLISQVQQFDNLFVTRVFPAFSDLTRAADTVRAESIERQLSAVATEEELDLGTIADEADPRSIAFYLEQMPMQQTLLNLFTTGLFHLFEQQMSSLKLTTLHIIAFDDDEGRMVKVDVPFWLLRLKSGPIAFSSYASGFDDDKVRLRVEDIERRGPGIVLDLEHAREGRVLIWAE